MAINYVRGKGVSYDGIDRAKQIGGAVLRTVASLPGKYVNAVVKANKNKAAADKAKDQAYRDQMIEKRGDPAKWPENQKKKAVNRAFGSQSNYDSMDALMQ